MKMLLLFTLLSLCLASCLLSCQNAGNKIGVDEKEIQGFKVKTFFNNSGNVEVAIASDGKTTIVAVPKTTISRQNQLSGDAISCLAKCAKIDDLESRLNCILLCPSKVQWQVSIFRGD